MNINKIIIIFSLVLANILQAKIEPEKKHEAQLRLIDSFLANHHYKNAVLDDNKSKEILDNYLEYLDFSKILLTKKDILKFKQYETLLDDFAHKGDLKEVYNMYDVSLTRRHDYISWALERLKNPFDDNVNGTIELDRDKLDWANNKKELQDRWKNWLTNEWLVLRLAKKTDKKAREILTKRYKNRLKRVNQPSSDDVFQLYANAITSVYDPHTSYFSPSTSEDFNINMSLSLEGIGARLSMEDELITVDDLIAGGPAKKSGEIGRNDKILGVAQGKKGKMEDVVGWRLNEAIKLIRGKRGTTVRLQIQKADTDDIVEVTLIRDKIKLEEAAAKSSIKKVNKDGRYYKIGIIEIPNFYMDFTSASRGDKDYRSTTRDVKKLIKKLKNDSIDGLLIDLRNNGGGSLTEAVSLTGLFFNKGPVVQLKDTGGNVEVYDDKDSGAYYDGPLGVLINQNSASASEIFTGAIKDYGRGIIMGEPTFGKGTVQTIIDMGKFLPSINDKAGQLKMTIAMFYRVNGSSTQLKGVAPNLYIPNKEVHIKGGEKNEKHALAWQKIEAVKHKMFPLASPKLVSQLIKDYHDINKDNLLMKTLTDYSMWNKEELKNTILSLSYKKRLARKNKIRDKTLMFQNSFRKIYGYPLITANYLDKKDKDKSDKEKANDKKYEIDAILDLSTKAMADYVQIIDDNKL